MQFRPTPIPGVHLIDLDRRGDDRGFFARRFCADEFAQAGLLTRFPQINTSLTARRHTLRGLHYQRPPAAEVKLVWCTRGALHDVVLDLRPDSPTHGENFAAVLDAENRTMMYVPHGCAHGFLTLADETEATYMVGAPYSPAHENGIRWNDPRFAIRWPAAPIELSAKDAAWPDYREDATLAGLL